MKNSWLTYSWRLTVAALFLPIISFCAPADSSLAFDFDFARFRMNDSTAMLEVYVGVQRHQLKFVMDGEGWKAGFVCDVAIARTNPETIKTAVIFRGRVIESGSGMMSTMSTRNLSVSLIEKAIASALIRYRWQVDHTFVSLDEIKKGQLLLAQKQFQLPVGDYILVIQVMDSNSRVSGKQSDVFQIEPFHPTNLSFSDLQFASMISKDSSASFFNKNNFKVVPNPSALYGTGMPMVYTYSEIYNLSFPSDSTYEITYRVIDGNGRVTKTSPAKRRPILGSSLVEVNAINIATLHSGSYTLEAKVVDHHSGQQALTARKFFVYREEDIAVSASPSYGADAIVESYRSMASAELDDEFDAARYIANDEEKKIFKSLNEDAKRDFLVRFWTRRDQSPETARNEFRENYLARVEYANNNFSGLRNGWKTDMGRVLLIYGFPSEIERMPSSGESRSHQVWKYYEIEGGVEFDFVDVKGWGNYELVNSTARHELQDPDWERWLRVQ